MRFAKTWANNKHGAMNYVCGDFQAVSAHYLRLLTIQSSLLRELSLFWLSGLQVQLSKQMADVGPS
jgi:hypothetical protein